MPVRPGRPPRHRASQTWATFVRNHLVGTLAIDFLTVPTVTFGVLYVFFVLSLERRRILHVNVTAHPHAAWAAQQLVEALGPDAPTAARLIRDRDGIREALDHVIVLGERHLLRLVRGYIAYYNEDRPHMSLAGDAPIARSVEPPGRGRVVALSRVGGLHHRYARAA
jgi:hypothetical protein